MRKALKMLGLFLVLAVILGCEKKGTFEKMGKDMDKSATKMDKALQDMSK